MASQDPPPPASSDPSPTGAITLPATFQIRSQDARLKSKPAPPAGAPVPPAPLGVLKHFHGSFAGSGFNLIFRPNSKAPTTTTFNNPVTQPVLPPNPPNENVLELNLTSETLTFSQPLGDVPNRGLIDQNDITLNGVPYVQVINDVTNLDTGKGDNPHPAGIHFEPGLWMHVPATTNDPVQGESLVRMASIPHGTTINAQTPNSEGLAPTADVAGTFPNGPKIDDVATVFNLPGGTLPFVIGQPQNVIRNVFQNIENANNSDTARLPQDLSKFIAAGTITQEVLNDPNTVLRKANEGKTITQTIVFDVSTALPKQEVGGGTANIAFLQGTSVATNGPNGPTQTGPNASAAQMSARFWINKVQHRIQVPVFKPGQPPLKIHPQIPSGASAPTFVIHPSFEITTPITITVTSTEIQYSQMVFLNFAGLTWPHVSVATLAKKTPIHVPDSALKIGSGVKL